MYADEPPSPSRYHPIRLDGSSLTLPQMAQIAHGAGVTADPDALGAMRRTQDAAARISERRHVYGRTTGVGAARETTTASASHGIRLLRAHAAGWGAALEAPVVRSALAIRANQLLAGGSGVSPELALALAELAGATDSELPVIHRYGGLGTGDLTALAEVGLALSGERPRADGVTRHRLDLSAADALPLMSSNAFTLAEAAEGTSELQRLSRAALVIAALTWVAQRGNPEAVATVVERATPFAGSREVTRATRKLVEQQQYEPLFIQDYFGLRTWPQVHGPLLDSLRRLAAVVAASVNATSENPLFTAASGDRPDEVTHHGGFHAAYLVLAVDTTLLALTRSAQAVQSRVSHLLTDRDSGLPLFLADATAGSSGALVGEYAAGSALAVILGLATAPGSVQTVGVSAGVEDDASFAGLAALRLGPAVEAYGRMLAVELVCAVRALRIRSMPLVGLLSEVLQMCSGLPQGMQDHDLRPDFAIAEAICEQLGEWWFSSRGAPFADGHSAG